MAGFAGQSRVNQVGGAAPSADRLEELGIVGAGGGGFPTAVKFKTRVSLFIVNAAECEPLLHKDKELLHHHLLILA
jgi:Na+-translocating ferredoxin:NAD+ oxidoreductase RnfC subunit